VPNLGAERNFRRIDSASASLGARLCPPSRRWVLFPIACKRSRRELSSPGSHRMLDKPVCRALLLECDPK